MKRIPMMTRRTWVIGSVAAVAVTVSGVGVAVASIPSSGGTFTGCYGMKAAPVELPSPVRVLDTRNKTGGVAGPFTGTVTVPVTTAVPAGATEVLGNLTATQEKGNGFFTTWASGDRPTTSSLNYGGPDVSNSVGVPLTSAGTFQLYSLRTAQALFDVTGYVRQVPGAVRLIDPSAGQTCAADETETTWNQQGPPGPAGAPGTVSNDVVGTADDHTSRTVPLEPADGSSSQSLASYTFTTSVDGLTNLLGEIDGTYNGDGTCSSVGFTSFGPSVKLDGKALSVANSPVRADSTVVKAAFEQPVYLTAGPHTLTIDSTYSLYGGGCTTSDSGTVTYTLISYDAVQH